MSLVNLKAAVKSALGVAEETGAKVAQEQAHVAHHEADAREALSKLEAARATRLDVLSRLTKGQATIDEADNAGRLVALAEAHSVGWAVRLDRAKKGLMEAEKGHNSAQRGAVFAQEEYSRAWRNHEIARVTEKLLDATIALSAVRVEMETLGLILGEKQVDNLMDARGYYCSYGNYLKK